MPRLPGQFADRMVQSDSGTQELSQVVDDLLAQLSTKFSSISSELLSKSKIGISALSVNTLTGTVDDMSRRLDNLEAKVMQSDRGSGDQGK